MNAVFITPVSFAALVEGPMLSRHRDWIDGYDRGVDVVGKGGAEGPAGVTPPGPPEPADSVPMSTSNFSVNGYYELKEITGLDNGMT